MTDNNAGDNEKVARKPAKTQAELLEYFETKELRSLLTKENVGEYAAQAGFTQVGKGVHELINQIALEELEALLAISIVAADKEGTRSLTATQAVNSIKSSVNIPMDTLDKRTHFHFRKFSSVGNRSAHASGRSASTKRIPLARPASRYPRAAQQRLSHATARQMPTSPVGRIQCTNPLKRVLTNLLQLTIAE